MAVTKEDIKYQIDQLKKDRMVYAIEAAALDLGAFIFIAFGYSLVPIPTQLAITISTVVFAIAVGFTVLMGLTNILRFKRIKELEKKLYK